MAPGYFLHTDAPTAKDSLERGDIVADMVRRATRCECPQVLGLHGDWGAGKTSVLMQLRAELLRSFPDQVVVVWFEAWRYQNEAAPIVALLHAIRERLDWASKAWSKTKRLTEVTIRSALLHWDEITRVVGLQAPKLDAAKIQTVGEKWEKEHLAQKLPTDSTTEILNQALNQLLGRPPKKGDHTPDDNRLIVVIDDLDRCNPEAAFRLLEGIKIYLGLERCVFILGINQREIERAIEKQIPATGDDDSRQARAKEYLDKLCGHIWRLSYLTLELQATLVEKLLSDAGLPVAFVQEVKGLVLGYGCLPPNPRKIKRFANALTSLWYRADAMLNPPKLAAFLGSAPPPASFAAILTFLACLDAFHPEFHRRLQQHDGCFESLVRWCQDETTLPKSDPLNEATKEVQLTHAGTSCLFYDPAAPHVFYPQRLIADACKSVLVGEIQPFLRL